MKKENILKIFIGIIVIIVISSVTSIATIFIYNSITNTNDDSEDIESISIKDFKITDFEIETNKTEYEYSKETSYTYTGSGTVTCSDRSNDYLVLIEAVKDDEEPALWGTTIHKGKGEIATYDYETIKNSENKKNSEPEYKFKVLSFIKLDK